MAEARPKRYVYLLTVYMGLIGLLDQYLSQVEGPIITYILADYSITATEYAFWQGIFAVISFLVFLLAWYLDKAGRKKGILALILALGIPSLIIVFPLDFFSFMIVYSIIIMATLSNAWETPVAEEAPPEKRGMLGSIAFLFGLIPLFAIIAVPIAESLGWRWAYGVMFFFALILIIPWLKMKETQRWLDSRDEHGETPGLLTALKALNKGDWWYVILTSVIYIMWTIVYICLRTWGGYYYITYQGYTTAGYSSILLVGALMTMVGAILSGILMDKVGRNATLVIACIGSAIAIFLLPTGITIFFWLAYLMMPMILAWIMVYINEIFPTRTRSTSVGVINTISRVGYVIGPLIASLLLGIFDNAVSVMTGFWIVNGIIILIPLFTLVIKPYETKGKVLEEIQQER